MKFFVLRLLFAAFLSGGLETAFAEPAPILDKAYYDLKDEAYALGLYQDETLDAALICQPSDSRTGPVSLSLFISEEKGGVPASDGTFTVNGRTVKPELFLRIDGKILSIKDVYVSSQGGRTRLVGSLRDETSRLLDTLVQLPKLIEVLGDEHVFSADISNQTLELVELSTGCQKFVTADTGKLAEFAKPQPDDKADPKNGADDKLVDDIVKSFENMGGTPAGPGTEDQAAANRDALYAKGDAFYYGNGVPQDYGAALEAYSAAAEAGHLKAMDTIGYMYDLGVGVKEDAETALKWYRKAAQAGFANGMANLGTMYSRGRAVEKDDEEANSWFRKAADAGSVLGMRELATSYYYGRGMDKDYAESAKWYQKAVDAGDVMSHWQLGALYLYGTGVDKDTFKAAELSYFAITHGEQYGLDNLLSEDGRRVPKNYIMHLQELLRDDSFYQGAVDGQVGKETREALHRAFATKT